MFACRPTRGVPLRSRLSKARALGAPGRRIGVKVLHLPYLSYNGLDHCVELGQEV